MSAVGFAIIAVLASACVKIIYRFSMKSGAGVWSTLVYYNLAGGAVLLLFLPAPDLQQIDSTIFLLLLLNGVIWVAAGLLDLYAFKYLSATDSDIFGSVRIVLLALAGVLLFGEGISTLAFIGIITVLGSMFFSKPTDGIQFGRGAFYRIAATSLVAVALIIDKHLATMINVETIAILGFLIPGALFSLIRCQHLKQMTLEIRNSTWAPLLAPLLGALRYYCIVQAFAVGELLTTTMILQSCVFFVFVLELLFLRNWSGIGRRGACSACCAIGATMACL